MPRVQPSAQTEARSHVLWWWYFLRSFANDGNLFFFLLLVAATTAAGKWMMPMVGCFEVGKPYNSTCVEDKGNTYRTYLVYKLVDVFGQQVSLVVAAVICVAHIGETINYAISTHMKVATDALRGQNADTDDPKSFKYQCILLLVAVAMVIFLVFNFMTLTESHARGMRSCM